MKTIKFTLVLFLVASLGSCTSQQKSSTKNGAKIEVVATNVFENLDENTQLIDVRTPGEYASGYIKNAVNMNVMDASFTSQITTLDKSKPLYVYCKSGNRSGKASVILRDAGFTQIYDLRGGVIQWKKEGKPLIQNK